jgi:hypothetical protein
MAGALVFAGLFTLRASEVLQTLNAVAAFACLGMVTFRPRRGALWLGGMTEYALHLAVSAALVTYGTAMLLFRDIDWRGLTSDGRRRHLAGVARGIAIALPLLILFGALFASADPIFRDILRAAAFFSPAEVVSHVVISAALCWLAGGYLRGVLLMERAPARELQPPAAVRMETTETGVVFGPVDALFLAFILVQFRYLFGGSGRVEASSTLTYADYARRGFFELVAVAALAAILVLAAHWLLSAERRTRQLFTVLAAILIALVFVVMVSALERMRLYQDTYGLTELRVYTTAFMGWLAIALAWIAATILRGRREQFTFGAVIAGFLLMGSLVALNPDGFIVERNVAAGSVERPVDVVYLLDLGPDAVPALSHALEQFPYPQRCEIAIAIRDRYADGDRGWRSWNLGHWIAGRQASRGEALTRACLPPAAQ